VRRASAIAGPISAFVLTVACGQASSPDLTGPSSIASAPTAASPVPLPAADPAPLQPLPSLVGRWFAGAQVVLRNRESGAVHAFSCQGHFFITEESARSLVGSVNLQGGGWNSDRYCTLSGAVNLELQAVDGSLARATVERRISAVSCQFVSGDGIYTGTVEANRIRLETTDVLNCNAPLVDGSGFPRADFDRTVTLRFERPATQ
jgi:hypothetical protein